MEDIKCYCSEWGEAVEALLETQEENHQDWAVLKKHLVRAWEDAYGKSLKQQQFFKFGRTSLSLEKRYGGRINNNTHDSYKMHVENHQGTFFHIWTFTGENNFEHAQKMEKFLNEANWDDFKVTDKGGGRKPDSSTQQTHIYFFTSSKIPTLAVGSYSSRQRCCFQCRDFVCVENLTCCQSGNCRRKFCGSCLYLLHADHRCVKCVKNERCKKFLSCEFDQCKQCKEENDDDNDVDEDDVDEDDVDENDDDEEYVEDDDVDSAADDDDFRNYVDNDDDIDEDYDVDDVADDDVDCLYLDNYEVYDCVGWTKF